MQENLVIVRAAKAKTIEIPWLPRLQGDVVVRTSTTKKKELSIDSKTLNPTM